jgi:hypothetical protein
VRRAGLTLLDVVTVAIALGGIGDLMLGRLLDVDTRAVRDTWTGCFWQLEHGPRKSKQHWSAGRVGE